MWLGKDDLAKSKNDNDWTRAWCFCGQEDIETPLPIIHGAIRGRTVCTTAQCTFIRPVALRQQKQVLAAYSPLEIAGTEV